MPVQEVGLSILSLASLLVFLLGKPNNRSSEVLSCLSLFVGCALGLRIP